MYNNILHAANNNVYIHTNTTTFINIFHFKETDLKPPVNVCFFTLTTANLKFNTKISLYMTTRPQCICQSNLSPRFINVTGSTANVFLLLLIILFLLQSVVGCVDNSEHFLIAVGPSCLSVVGFRYCSACVRMCVCV